MKAIDRITETIHNGMTIFSGWLNYSFYAKCGNIYEGGYTSQRGAINAVKRRLNNRDKKALARNIRNFV